jgi:hypothetical protein
MSFEDLKKEVVTLSQTEQKRLTAFMFSLWHQNDPEYQSVVSARIEDKDPTKWISLEQFEAKLQGN